MSTSASMAPINTTGAKKTKGMKDHKKALKENAIAKRAAAAELAKTKKNPIFVSKPKVTDRVDVGVSTSDEDINTPPNDGSAEDKAVDNIAQECGVVQVIGVPESEPIHDGAPDGVLANHVTRKNDVDEPTFGIAASPDVEHRPLFLVAEVAGQASLNTTETNQPSATNPHPLQQYDTGSELEAYNKALEAELYENMESPQQRLLRLGAIKSWDSEAIHDTVRIADSPECDLCDSVDDTRSVDFSLETTIAHTQSIAHVPAEEVSAVLADSILDISHEMPADTPAGQLSSVGQLFAGAGTPIICLPIVTGTATVTGLPRAANAMFDEPTQGILPAEAGSKYVSGVRTLACVDAGITFGQFQPAPESFVDPAIVSFAIKKQDTAAARPFQASSVPQQHPPLFTNFDDGAQKLKALLGVTGPAPPTIDDPTLQAGAEMLKSMLGIRSRAISLESSAQNSHVSSSSYYVKPQTPITQYSTSPFTLPEQCVDGAVDYGNNICPPWYQFAADGHHAGPYSFPPSGFLGALPDQCVYGTVDYGNGTCPPWSQSAADGYYADPYSYPTGFLDAPFVPQYFAGHPDMVPVQPYFFQGLDFIPVQPEFLLGSPADVYGWCPECYPHY
ncbi:hypothetical protein FB567DRAFT_192620 [Paraphoma chrysanthemicola]|uniref:Uncharacterized protein n=1 Tax=Paraphoma chrysanthemicola TaxID=798071 RepID=A0A8K0QVV6_9PLEO|nr:hypothetical protein FB567DRAFT_192620 [Paraphoma chrysanthemicola]